MRHRVDLLVGVVVLCLFCGGCGVGAPPRPLSVTPTAGSTRTVADPGTIVPPSEGPTPTIAAQVMFPPGLDDAHAGQIYAEVDAAVLRIDLRSRSVQRIATPRLDSLRDFVATRRFLVVKQTDDGAGFVVAQDGTVLELPSELRVTGRLYAAGKDGIWVVAPEEPTDGHRVISQFSTATDDLTLLGRRTIPEEYGIPWSDAAGQLLAQGTAATFVVTRSSTKRLLGWRRGWELIGIGKTSMLVQPCPRCDVALRNRNPSDKQRRATARGLRAVDKLITTNQSSADGLLSPTGRYLALTVTQRSGRHESRLTVTDLVTGKTSVVPGSMASSNANDQFLWLSPTTDRWLLVVSDRTLHIVDTRSGTVHIWRDIDVERIAAVIS